MCHINSALRLLSSLLCAFLLIMVSGCKKTGLCEDEPLDLAKQDYRGRQLRIDGFYYGNASDADFQGRVSYETLLFYRNGVCLLPGGTAKDELPHYITSISNSSAFMQNTHYAWGLFAVDGNRISIAEWIARPSCYYSMLRTGEITSDTTFVLTTSQERRYGKKRPVETIHQEFQFRLHTPKPDSTNNFL